MSSSLVTRRVLATALLVGVGAAVIVLPSFVRGRGRGLPFRFQTSLVDSGQAPRDSRGLDSTRVMAALGRVNDPELDVSITELGLVRRIGVDSGGNVTVVLRLTAPDCPYVFYLLSAAVEAVKLVPGARRVSVSYDPSLVWAPSHLTGRARVRYESLFGPGVNAGK